MRRSLPGSAGALPDTTYVELVASLFATRVPTAIMGILFVIAGALVQVRTHDAILLPLLAAGAIASVARIVVLVREDRRLATAAVSMGVARSVERRFAAGYIAFAAILGAFGARVLQLPAPALHMLIAILLVGYAAGVAAGTALRPWISVASLLLAIVPACAVMAATPDAAYRVAALSLLLLLAGGVRSLVERYRSEASKTTRRQTFSLLARRDHLTGLPNRLALAERFAELAAGQGGGAGFAVHCLDLDDFKPVNDRFGHPTGDALLCAVAERLGESVRGDDFAARLGGDEFVFVQTGIRRESEAAAMARRLERHLGDPYRIRDRSIVIGASIGFAVSDGRNTDFDRLVAVADDALRAHKAQRKPPNGAGTVVPLGRSGPPADRLCRTPAPPDREAAIDNRSAAPR